MLTSCVKGIQEQEPGCWKADLKLAVASKERPVVHVCESKSNSRLHQPRRGRANPVALCSGLESSGSQVRAFPQSEAFIPCVLGLLRHFPRPLKARYPSAGHGWLDDPSFQKQYSSGHVWGNPVGLVGTG